MNQEQLRKKIQHSLREGFSEQEVRQVLRQQGLKHSQINQAFNQIKNQQQNRKAGPEKKQNSNLGEQKRPSTTQEPSNQTQKQNTGLENGFQDDDLSGNPEQNNFQQNQSSSGGTIPGLNLTDNYYRIKQQLLLARYSVFDQNDEKVLRAKGKIFSLKTDIPFFKPGEEQPLFRVTSERLANVSNNYEVKNEQNNEKIAVLDRKRTLLNQIWRIRDPQDNSIVATIKNENTVLQFLRTYGGIIPYVPNPFAFVPHTYEISDVNDNQIGELDGELSIKDKYELKLKDSGDMDKESMISSIIAIDALEGN